MRKKKNVKLRRNLPKEIVVGFETHVPSSVKKKKRHMDKADIVLVELEPAIVRAIETGNAKDIHYLALQARFPKFAEEYFKLLKEQMGKDKLVIGTDVGKWEAHISRLGIKQKNKFSRDLEASMEAKSVYDKTRAEKRVKYILNYLKGRNLEGKKMFVDAGTLHTIVYHDIKRALKNEEKAGLVKVKREYLTKGMLGDKRVLMKYEPAEQLERMFIFKRKLTQADKERIKELVEQEKIFGKKAKKSIINYIMQEGIDVEDALEKTYFELLKRQTRKGLKKVKVKE